MSNPCPRCHRPRELERQENENDDVVENYYYYYTPIPGIRESNVRILNPYDQCFCRDESLVQQERRRTGIDIPGKCYPTDLCTDCDLNYSGLCPQQNKYDSGIYIPDLVPPYVRPIYFPPYARWYPYSPYRPPWSPWSPSYRPNGYGPRPKPFFPPFRGGKQGK